MHKLVHVPEIFIYKDLHLSFWFFVACFNFEPMKLVANYGTKMQHLTWIVLIWIKFSNLDWASSNMQQTTDIKVKKLLKNSKAL